METDKIRMGFELKQLNKTIGRYIHSSPSIRSAESMTGTHAWIIGFLTRNENTELFQKDVEKEMNISRSTATGILQLMEKNGLIYREPVERDARLKKICLTEKTRSLDDSIRQDFDSMDACIVEGMTEDEIQTFFNLLTRANDNLERVINERKMRNEP